MRLEAIYLDTDGAYIAGGDYATVGAFAKHFNEVVLPAKLAELGCVHGKLTVEHQEQFERIIFPQSDDGEPAAKRYAARFAIWQGKPVDGIVTEVKGLEYKRSDASRLTRRFQKEAVDLLMAGEENPESFEKLILRWRDFIMAGEVPAEDICKSSGVKDFEAYKIRRRKDGTKIIPAQLRVAEELRSRGENPFRVQYIVTDATTSPMTVIPLSDYDGDFDRHYVWNSIYPATLRLLAGAFPTSVNWNHWLARRPKKALPGQLGLGLT